MTRPPHSYLVQDRAPAPPLNENHVRRIQATFWYVDDLLRSIEALTHPDPSPFVRERPDLSQDEARMLLSFVSLARKRMLAALDRLGIPRPEQKLSARRSVATGLLYAEISLSELDTRSLRGYGAMDPVAGEEITAVSADLQNLMRRGMALLKEQEEGGLAEQVAGLAGPAGEVLRRLLAVSTARGLTEMRPLIAAAAERAAATTLDVGVFGRVSSGKSSLINALVGEGVLPVGATPVTAVPLRVGRGPHSVEVRFRDGRTEQIPLSALPELATEEKNPQNARGVRSIEVTVPGAPPGLRLLDTPGVGSLASSGSAQAFAWLPRCDFGLVLVAAGTPLGRDETALLSGLRNAGIDCSVVLSKADLLDPADRERTRGYIAAELVPVLGPDERVDVRAVSTREGQSAGLDALRTDMLLPLASDHVQRATDALRTRLRRLVALTAASLNGGPPAGDAVAIDFEKQRGAAAEAVGKTTDALASAAKRILEDTAEAVAASWARGEDPAPAARSAIVSAANRGLSAVREAVDRVRSHAGEGEEATARRLPPLFDPEFLDAIKPLPPPRLAPGLLRRSRAHSAVDSLLPFLDQALARYAARLLAWGEGALKELRPAGDLASTTDARSPELAGLDTLIAQVGGSPRDQAQPDHQKIPQNAR
jgi:GTP-binding protein EngB required for normal cell division